MKRLLIISGSVVAVLLLLVVLAPLFINVDSFRPQMEQKLSAALNRHVQIGKLEASIFSGGASASDISIADDPAFNKGPFLRASSLKVGVELMPLIFSRQLRVTSLTVQKPEITLLKNAAGKWNYSTLGAAQPSAPAASGSGKSTPDISVEKFEITDGTVRVGHSSGHSAGKESVYQNVNLVARNISASTAMPFTLSVSLPGGGKLALEGQAGPLNQTDSTKSPLDAKITLSHVDLGATGFVDPSSGVGGTLDFDGQVKSDGQRAHSEGKATVTGLKAMKGAQPAKQPVSVDYKSDYALASESGTINSNLHIGKSLTNASGTLTSKGEDMLANLKIQGKDMPVNDVEGLLPAFGVVLPSGSSLQGGAINMDLTAEGPLDRLVINGPLNISGTHLSGYNLTSKLGALAAFTGNKSGSTDTLIQTFSSALRVAPDGIKADNIVLDVPSLGTLTGNGVISSDNSLDFKMLLKLSGGANNLLGSLTGVSMAQSKGLPFLIEGKTSNPVFRPALGETVKGNLQNAVLQSLQGNKSDAQGQDQQNLKGVLGGLLNNKKKKPQQ
jgi:AsmA protein